MSGIDVLRFLAASSVLLFHYTYLAPSAFGWPAAPFLAAMSEVSRYGYLGVHVFFVISGFVIVHSAEGTDAAGFFSARVTRIFPLYAVSAALTLAVLSAAGRADASVGWYLANLTLAPQAFGMPWIDGVYWSLRYEMQFYVFVLVLIAAGRLAQWGPSLALIWLAISAAYAAGVLPEPIKRIFVADFAPLFVVGAALQAWMQHPSRSKALLLLTATGVAVACELRHAALIGDPDWTELSRPIIACVVAAAPALVYVAARAGLRRRSLYYFLGALSYPLYLLHQQIGLTVATRLEGYGAILATLAATATALTLATALCFADLRARPLVRDRVERIVRMMVGSFVRVETRTD